MLMAEVPRSALDERPGKMNDYSFMPRTRTDDKRQRILDAAVRVFARKGYFASRVSDVAKAAGIADGTIYLYFRNKDDVLVSLFDEIMSEHVEAGRREISNIEGAQQKLLAIAQHHLRLLGGNRELAVVFQVELRQSTKFMERFTATWLKDYFDLLQSVIESGQREGTIRKDLRRKLASHAFFGILDEMVTTWVLSPQEYDLAQLAGSAVELFLYGAASPAKSARGAT
jgi:TetR/AcrR family transcriptional regulator, fatty acid metabolism regulator protein